MYVVIHFDNTPQGYKSQRIMHCRLCASRSHEAKHDASYYFYVAFYAYKDLFRVAHKQEIKKGALF